MKRTVQPHQPRFHLDALERRVHLSAARVVGYFPEYRWSRFNSIDWEAVTHVNYFSLTAGTDGSLSQANIDTSHLQTLVATAHGHGDTVSITVGPQSFSTIASSTTATNNFVNNLIQFCETYDLDGIDMDWEPTPTGTNITRYGTLISALHAQTSTRDLLLTAAVNPLNKEIPLSAIPKMSWLNVMCYDFWPDVHSTYADATAAMNGWHTYGVPKDKLLMGMPFYGRKGSTWSTTQAEIYGQLISNYFNQNGTYPSPSVNELNGFHFNGQDLIRDKAEFVRDEGFGGAMIWELGQDHFVGGQFTVMSLLPVIESVLADTVAPVVTTSAFAYQTAPHRLRFTFSENVGPSLQTSDLVVRDTVTQATIIVNAVNWDGATNTATFTLNNVVPDGTYRATLSGAGVTDPAGNPLGGDHAYDFFFLAGDANHDARVDLNDFNILAANFGQGGRDFTQGDFNYDGTVNLLDFNVLAGRFGTTIGAAATAGPGAGSSRLFDTRDDDDEPAAVLV
jgi:GH18 family chitinase